MATTVLGPSWNRRHYGITRVAAVLDFLFGLLYLLLGIRLVLVLVEARSVGFVRFIARLTDPFYAPFRGIVPSQTVEGGHAIAWSIVVAIVAYAVLHAVLRGLLRLVDRA